MRGNKNKRPASVESSQSVDLKSTNDLVVTEYFGRGIYGWGKDNEYPSYLYNLRDNQPQHGGILNGKAKYLSGVGIKASTPLGEEFLKRANPKEDQFKISEKYNKTFTDLGCRAVKVVPNLLGRPLWFFHIDFALCRISKCETEIHYCEDWSNQYKYGVQVYPIFYPGCTEVSIYLQKNYNPAAKKIDSIYPALEYKSGIKSIDTLIRIDNSRNSLVINDFSGGTAIVIYGEKPETQEELNKITSKIRKKYSGDEKNGEIPIIFAGSDPAAKGAEFITVPTNGLDKKYLEMTSSATKNVYAAHNVPPELFNYISDTSSVFDKQKLVDQNELFMNNYVIPNQKGELDMLKMFFELKYPGQTCEFEIEQFDPIGLDLPLDNQTVVDSLNGLDPNIIPKWLVKKFKLPVTMTQDPSGNPIIPIQQQANDHLKNLTGKQNINIKRIIREFQSGKWSEAQASILLKPYGLTDQEIKEMLGTVETPVGQVPIQQRMAFVVEQNFFALFDKYAHDVNPDDEVIETNFIDNKVKFEEQVDVKTNTAVLNLIKENEGATNEQIASILGIDIKDVESALKWLVLKELLDEALKPTPKALKAKKTVFYTEYFYDKAPGVSGPVLLSTSREFCIEFYGKFKEGKKALSYEAINRMTNDFGQNVWDYRGGWRTIKGTDESVPFCRHGFVGVTKIKYE